MPSALLAPVQRASCPFDRATTSIPFIGIVSFTPRSSRNVSSCHASRVLPFGAGCPSGAPNTTAARTASPAPMRSPIISVRIATSGAPTLRMVRFTQEPQRTLP